MSYQKSNIVHAKAAFNLALNIISQSASSLEGTAEVRIYVLRQWAQ